MGIITSDKKAYWPDGCVPFQIDIDNSVFPTTVNRINTAVAAWNDLEVGIRLIPRTTQTNYISFQSFGGGTLDFCSSTSAGMAGGIQIILVPENPNPAVSCRIVHEIGHALGMIHEHTRSDRDDWVTIDFDNVEPLKVANFVKANGTGSIDVGSYDYSSMMHYCRRSFAIDPSKDVFIAPPTNGYANLLCSLGAYEFSLGDQATAARFTAGNTHVYKTFPHGEVNHTVDMRSWSAGWTITAPFSIGSKNYLFFLKEGDGWMIVREINSDGSIGEIVDNQDWSSGWTSAAIYTIWGKNHLFLLKKGDGRMHVNEINADGTIGPIIDNKDWSSGWTSASTFAIGGQNYLFLLKESDGQMHVNRINADGTIGPIIDNKDWSSGWTSASTFAIGGQNYLFLLKESDGRMHVNRINADGTIGALVDNRDWSSGWTTAKTFAIGGQNYLFLLKRGNGRMHMHQITPNGKIGSMIDLRMWSPGWTTVSFYSTVQGTYVSMMKA
ncbi:MAG: hypothetical protein KDI55_20945 [Anaerolineae bacterium]|nr:hypothetical protein [Anaerolineae bacterium]MCB0256197.1 hypothetical protein [Anaerolineae bacterium]